VLLLWPLVSLWTESAIRHIYYLDEERQSHSPARDGQAAHWWDSLTVTTILAPC